VLRGGNRAPVPRKVLGRTISAATARQLTAIMESVVTAGTGTAAQVEGYTVAGKTGTASKVVNGVYSRSDYNVSFVGFVPSREPSFAIVVVVDSPRKVSPYGGVVAAPIFQKIAASALRHAGIPPSIDRAPPVLVARSDEERERERPAIGRETPVIAVAATPAGEQLFPDLTGMSARAAARTLARLGVGATLHGTGVVIDQRPPAGTPLARSAAAMVWLGRAPRTPPPDGEP
jgi:cell division protein FtsI (penicillin-binding protein 3)